MIENEKKPARRDGPDFWLKLVHWVGAISWFFLVTILAIIDKAKPQEETFFERIRNVEVRKYWDTNLVEYAFYLMVFSFLLSLFTLYINSKRMKRKGDRYSISVIVMGIFSLIGIIVYYVRF